MEITYKQAESLERPSEIDTTSSTDGIFIRKNITAVDALRDSGESYLKYVYDEAFLTPDEYELYKTESYKEAVNSLVIRRESEIADEVILQLIEEGSL